MFRIRALALEYVLLALSKRKESYVKVQQQDGDGAKNFLSGKIFARAPIQDPSQLDFVPAMEDATYM